MVIRLDLLRSGATISGRVIVWSMNRVLAVI